MPKRISIIMNLEKLHSRWPELAEDYVKSKAETWKHLVQNAMPVATNARNFIIFKPEYTLRQSSGRFPERAYYFVQIQKVPNELMNRILNCFLQKAQKISQERKENGGFSTLHNTDINIVELPPEIFLLTCIASDCLSIDLVPEFLAKVLDVQRYHSGITCKKLEYDFQRIVQGGDYNPETNTIVLREKPEFNPLYLETVEKAYSLSHM